MQGSCLSCGAEGELGLPEPNGAIGMLACPLCGGLIGSIDVSYYRAWIEGQVARKRKLQLVGALGTRKQSGGQSDEEIDRDGLAAELAACILLAPGFFESWRSAAIATTGNRGRDIPAAWVGLKKPLEIKQTRYKDSRRGCLIVRPPRWTPGEMKTDYIDDSVYVLIHGEPFEYELLGWIDRKGLIARGELNPVPVRPGQRECWGIHWSKLYPMTTICQ